MKLAEFATQIFSHSTAPEHRVLLESQPRSAPVISEEASNWNKLALLVSIEGEKPPSQRKKVEYTILPTTGSRRSARPGMTTSQWNEIALKVMDAPASTK